MAISIIDLFDFLFNGGRGIRADQIDWSVDDQELDDLLAGKVTAASGARQIHIVLLTSFNAVTRRIEGSPFQDVPSIAVGDLVFFYTPSALPNVAERAFLQLTLNGGITNFQIFTVGLVGIDYNELVPDVVHRGIRVPQGLVLIDATGSSSLEKRVTRTISNLQLKSLETDYVQLIPAPGAGKFIQVEQIFITKNGDDVLGTWTEPSFSSSREYTGEHPRYRSAISPTTNVTAQQLMDGYAQNVRSGAVAFDGSTETADQVYFFLATLEKNHPVNEDLVLSSLTYRWPNIQRITLTPADYTRLPGTIEVDGDDYIVYRLNNPYPRGHAISHLTGNSGVWVDHGGPTIGPFGIYSWVDLGLFLPGSAPLPAERPLYVTSSSTYITRLIQLEMWDLLAKNDGHLEALALGGHVITENQPVMLGMLSTRAYQGEISGRSPADYDATYADINDVTFDVVVSYQIHTV